MDLNPTYPSIDEVEAADLKQLLTWYRFLPAATAGYKVEVMQRIAVGLHRLRSEDDAAFIEASKEVGW